MVPISAGVYSATTASSTGIACGAEVANLFIFALTAAAFARYAHRIHVHKRFIDDGFIVWRGTAAAARAMIVRRAKCT